MKHIIIITITVIIIGVFSLIYTKNNVKSSLVTISPLPSTIASNTTTLPLYTPSLPTISQIFDNEKINIATLPANKIRTIIVTGDIIPARSVNTGVLRRNNPLWPYEKVQAGIKALNGDITFASLETPLIKDCPPTDEGMIFCGSDKNIEGLKYIGVDIVTMANNHAGNHGEEGVLETIQSLQQNGIKVTGINGALYQDIKGMTFAFLGYNDISKDQPGIADAEDARIKKEITEAKQKADVIIVQYHWGEEYRSQPDDRQKYLGRFTIDAGADVVIGNHPHWIQPIEIYKGKLITYAHGNFIFDQMWSEETKQGVIGKYTFYENQLIDVEYFPIYIQDYGQASFLEGEEKETILQNMFEESKKLAHNS